MYPTADRTVKQWRTNATRDPATQCLHVSSGRRSFHHDDAPQKVSFTLCMLGSYACFCVHRPSCVVHP